MARLIWSMVAVGTLASGCADDGGGGTEQHCEMLCDAQEQAIQCGEPDQRARCITNCRDTLEDLSCRDEAMAFDECAAVRAPADWTCNGITPEPASGVCGQQLGDWLSCLQRDLPPGAGASLPCTAGERSNGAGDALDPCTQGNTPCGFYSGTALACCDIGAWGQCVCEVAGSAPLDCSQAP